MNKAVILGATGAVGREILSELLNNTSYDKVYVVGRQSITKLPNQDKFEKVIIDFDDMTFDESILDDSHVFVAFGTTLKQAGSKNAQYKIDYTYVFNFAQKCQNKVRSFNLVSSMGASSNSRSFYTRLKGELEKDILLLNLGKLRIFRPSLLIVERKGRFLESLGLKLLPIFNLFTIGKFIHWRPIKPVDLAKSMVNAVIENREETIYTHQNFKL